MEQPSLILRLNFISSSAVAPPVTTLSPTFLFPLPFPCPLWEKYCTLSARRVHEALTDVDTVAVAVASAVAAMRSLESLS